MIFWQKYRLELRSSMNGRSDDQISPTANRCARSAKAEFQTYTTHPSPARPRGRRESCAGRSIAGSGAAGSSENLRDLAS